MSGGGKGNESMEEKSPRKKNGIETLRKQQEKGVILRMERSEFYTSMKMKFLVKKN